MKRICTIHMRQSEMDKVLKVLKCHGIDGWDVDITRAFKVYNFKISIANFVADEATFDAIVKDLGWQKYNYVAEGEL